VLWGSGSQVGRVFAENDTSYLDAVSLPAVLATGVLYVGYNLASLPATLFTLDRLTRPAQAAWAGLITGVLSTIPFALTFLAILAFYPDPEVLDADVPWLVMLQQRAGSGITALYAVVVLWTLVETCIGLLHALTDRVDASLREMGRRTLSARSIALLTASALIVAALFSRVGLIALVARGYTLMAYGFLALFALPLMTVGVWRILRAARHESNEGAE